LYGPGSAAHHAVKDGALRCVRGTEEKAAKNFCPYEDLTLTLFLQGYIPTTVLSDEGALSGKRSINGQSES
jgi:hypothetical protein